MFLGPILVLKDLVCRGPRQLPIALMLTGRESDLVAYQTSWATDLVQQQRYRDCQRHRCHARRQRLGSLHGSVEAIRRP